MADSRYTLGNIEYSHVTENELISRVSDKLSKNVGSLVVTPNIDFYSKIRKNPALIEIISGADFILCDSTPIYFLSRITKKKIEKIPGSNLISVFLNFANSRKLSVAFFGGSDSTKDLLEPLILANYPYVTGVYVDSGFHESISLDEIDEMVEILRKMNARIVFVGYGFPKQELLSYQLQKRLPNNIYLNIGMGIKYFTGEMKRSPKIMSTLGLEWLWRCMHEPRRLFKRYFLDGIQTYIQLLRDHL